MTGKVFLRPDEWHRPVNYIKSVEKAGLIVLPQQNLALMTCKTGPNQGPEGPQGPPGTPYLYDTIIASCSDEFSPLQVDPVTPATTFRAPFPITITQVRISLTTAPAGSDVIVDLKMNGVSIFSEPLHIDPGSKTSVGSATPAVITITNVPDDAEFLPFIIQAGSTIPGSGLKIAVTGTKVVE